jgi:lysophospholipase L1-like esterase
MVENMKLARIYVFGDSLVAGTYDSEGGWCDRLKRDMHRITADSQDGTKYQLYNLGIGGETSRGLAARIKNELAARHTAAWPAVVIIAIGKNDSRLTDGQEEVSLDEYRQNLTTIVEAAREVTDRIMIVGLGPCAAEGVNFKQYVYSRERIAQYEAALTDQAQQLDTPKIDVYDAIASLGERAFYRDNLHLSDEGYAAVYEIIKPYVVEMLDR